MLEFLLFYSIPRIDTKPIARALLNHFGSFNAVLEGTKEELMMVPGVGESTAMFIQLLNATVKTIEAVGNNVVDEDPDSVSDDPFHFSRSEQ